MVGGERTNSIVSCRGKDHLKRRRSFPLHPYLLGSRIDKRVYQNKQYFMAVAKEVGGGIGGGRELLAFRVRGTRTRMVPPLHKNGNSREVGRYAAIAANYMPT